jgi:hypothetical protein
MRNLRSVKNYKDTGLGFTQFYRDIVCLKIHFFVRENNFSVRKKHFLGREIHIFVEKGLTPDDKGQKALFFFSTLKSSSFEA